MSRENPAGEAGWPSGSAPPSGAPLPAHPCPWALPFTSQACFQGSHVVTYGEWSGNTKCLCPLAVDEGRLAGAARCSEVQPELPFELISQTAARGLEE